MSISLPHRAIEDTPRCYHLSCPYWLWHPMPIILTRLATIIMTRLPIIIRLVCCCYCLSSCCLPFYHSIDILVLDSIITIDQVTILIQLNDLNKLSYMFAKASPAWFGIIQLEPSLIQDRAEFKIFQVELEPIKLRLGLLSAHPYSLRSVFHSL